MAQAPGIAAAERPQWRPLCRADRRVSVRSLRTQRSPSPPEGRPGRCARESEPRLPTRYTSSSALADRRFTTTCLRCGVTRAARIVQAPGPGDAEEANRAARRIGPPPRRDCIHISGLMCGPRAELPARRGIIQPRERRGKSRRRPWPTRPWSRDLPPALPGRLRPPDCRARMLHRQASLRPSLVANCAQAIGPQALSTGALPTHPSILDSSL
jgi:hypothetical protein